MEYLRSARQLVTLGLVDSSIGAMSKGLALVDVKVSITKELPSSNLVGHFSCAKNLVVDLILNGVNL